MTFLKRYYDTEGPLGFPLRDAQAFALEALLRELPRSQEFRYRKSVLAQGAELHPGERADVSWISTEDPDRSGEVVRAAGLDDRHYRLNPIVTMQHAYHLPPVGRSLWRKVAPKGLRHGVKAKTHYPPRPQAWEGTWPADAAFTLIQADLLRGKSIGFLPTRVHAPSRQERDQPGWEKVELVIDHWVLLEYACCFLPCQQHAVVEAVSKSALTIPDEFLALMGVERPPPSAPFLPSLPSPLPHEAWGNGGASLPPGERQRESSVLPLATASGGSPAPPGEREKGAASRTTPASGFTPLEELEAALVRRLGELDLETLGREVITATLDRLRGRV